MNPWTDIADRWDPAACAGFDEPELLLYRSNLLGSDLRVTNFAGGNTSAKVIAKDPLTGEGVDVLFVKGSGGDLGSMTMSGFATLYLDRLISLKDRYRGLEHEDEMVGLLPHCTFDLNPRAASIDTPLHAFVPHRHVDHMHPDAVIAVAAADGGESLVREIFGAEIGWLPWQRPGFDLGLRLEEACAAAPGMRGIVLGGHGLFTWGDSAESCYRNTIAVINRAAAYLREHQPGQAFGGVRVPALPASARRDLACDLLPRLRGAVSGESAKVGHFNDDETVLTFVGSKQARDLAQLGTSCPDHFLRTKIRPLFLHSGDDSGDDREERLEAYRADYLAYYERCRRPDSPPARDPNPVVVLIPGTGMITFAKDKATARIAGEFFVNAINVMHGAQSVSRYVALPEQEAFDIEYWLLEEAKLKRMPPPRPLAGRVALVTGAAGGIGRATAATLLADGACAVLVDVDQEGLAIAERELAGQFGDDNVTTVACDVTREESVVEAVRSAVLAFGGIDVLVSNAGIASAAPFDETDLALWNRNLDVLATGYFLVSRETFKVMKAQGNGGSIVFVGSKNALAASPQAAAYNTAKAAELQLARTIALEGAPHGIRANVVNPDAVLRGSKIWSGNWRQERAAAYGIDDGELEEHYRKRSLLGRSVFPEDVAEAIRFFASESSAKSTGNVLNVDAGNAGAFPR